MSTPNEQPVHTRDETAAPEFVGLTVESVEVLDGSVTIRFVGGAAIYGDRPEFYTPWGLEGPPKVSPLGDPPAHLADAWARYQRGEHLDPSDLSKLDEWRAERAMEAGF